MKIQRDLRGTELIKRLEILGYAVTRQSGSHIRLTTNQKGEHHITIPKHEFLKIGTLNGILKDVAVHFNFTKEELISTIF